MTNARSRGWCFTINNPNGWDEADIDKLKEASTYGVVGKEIGEEGTSHFQGYVRFEHPKTFAQVKAIITRAHIEKQKGTITQAADYCKKDGHFDEWGDAPLDKDNNKKWKDIIFLAETGNVHAIKDRYPDVYLRYLDKLLSLRIRHVSIIQELQNEWWYGETGTGKSRKIWDEYPNHYPKMLNKWWDGYDDQEIVVIEEWSPKNDMTASALKIWADRYPFNAEVKGGVIKKIRPRRIIVTSNYTLEQCFERAEDIEPLKRRFKQIRFSKLSWDVDKIMADF